ncbi:hypothetical protein [Methylobacterium sp. Leaf118]|uniref:hypothetical protein n=1 Tax=Methylobacterium sp. Leaf118 TaxID=2876562 RepID=UPI001E48999D|nr:hypothetical protein [Methylobacterium sp. Leaf118]
MSLAFPVLAAMTPLSFAAQGSELHIDAAEFTVSAETRLGERVTVDNCHLVFATENEATCIGLGPRAAAGEDQPPGRLLVRMVPMPTRASARSSALCEGGALDDACHVSVTGVVEDLSGTFGIADQRMFGLREGTIHWPD